jgi:hypothetical protein
MALAHRQGRSRESGVWASSRESAVLRRKHKPSRGRRGARERVEAFAQHAVERADALRSRKSRSPNVRGDFVMRDPGRL